MSDLHVKIITGCFCCDTHCLYRVAVTSCFQVSQRSLLLFPQLRISLETNTQTSLIVVVIVWSYRTWSTTLWQRENISEPRWAPTDSQTLGWRKGDEREISLISGSCRQSDCFHSSDWFIYRGGGGLKATGFCSALWNAAIIFVMKRTGGCFLSVEAESMLGAVSRNSRVVITFCTAPIISWLEVNVFTSQLHGVVLLLSTKQTDQKKYSYFHDWWALCHQLHHSSWPEEQLCVSSPRSLPHTLWLQMTSHRTQPWVTLTYFM